MTDLILTSEKVKEAHQVAISLFKDKKDRGGKPYIEHLERVAVEAVKKYRNWSYSKEPITATKEDFEDIYCAALLHDVLEDTDYKSEDLEIYFGEKVAIRIWILTNPKHINFISYEDYIKSIAWNDNIECICIKLADLEDNMDITRLTKQLKESDLQRLKKYHDSWLYLTQKLKEI